MQKIKDIWDHGKYFDMWSIVHFLSGVLLAAVLFYWRIDFVWSLIIALVLMIFWEVFEAVIDIIEEWPNIISDIIIGLAGFLLVSYFYLILGRPFLVFEFWLILIVWAGLELLGYLAYKRIT